MVAGSEDVLRYLIQEKQYNNKDYEAVYTINEVSYWIAFNKNTNDNLVQSIQSSFDALVKK